MVVIQGNNIKIAQILTWRSALKLECMGMTRHGRSVYSIVKEQFAFKGNKTSVYKQLDDWCVENLRATRRSL